MTELEFANLNTGDIVCSKSSGRRYVVHANFGRRVVAVSVADLTNPAEWELTSKVKHAASGVVSDAEQPIPLPWTASESSPSGA